MYHVHLIGDVLKELHTLLSKLNKIADVILDNKEYLEWTLKS